MTQLITSCSQPAFGLCLGIVHCLGSDKCMRTCIHHYGTTQAVFTKSSLKIPCAPAHPPAPQTLAAAGLYTVFIALLSPSHHEVGILQHGQIGFFHFVLRNQVACFLGDKWSL